MEKLYRLLYPMRIVMVSSRAENKDNIMTAAWCFPLSGNPPMFGISLAESRYSYSMIKEGGCFGINLVSPELESAARLCGTKSGRDLDKFSEAKLTKEEGEEIDCALIKESPVSIECKLVDTIKTGDHYLLVGEAVKVHRRTEAAKGLYQKAGTEWIEV